MKRQFFSGFPRALLSLSQEKSSGVEIELEFVRCELVLPSLYWWSSVINSELAFRYAALNNPSLPFLFQFEDHYNIKIRRVLCLK